MISMVRNGKKRTPSIKRVVTPEVTASIGAKTETHRLEILISALSETDNASLISSRIYSDRVHAPEGLQEELSTAAR